MRNRTDDFDAPVLKAQAPNGERGYSDSCDRPSLCTEVCEPRLEPKPKEHRLKTFADPKQKRCRTDANHQCRQAHITEMREQRTEDLWQCVSVGLNTKDMLELARRYQKPRCCDETCNHRMTQEVRKKAEAHHAHHSEQSA